MKQYLEGLQLVLDKGFDSGSARNGMPETKVYNDIQMRFDLSNDTLPIITTKRMPPRSIIAELLCFMAGITDVRTYSAMGCNVWWANAYKWNILNDTNNIHHPIEKYKTNTPSGTPYTDVYYDLGRIYPAQWRNYKGLSKTGIITRVDQLSNLINSIIDNPDSRYHNMSAWNPAEMNDEQVSQPNCHVYFQITCRKLDNYERNVVASNNLVSHSPFGGYSEKELNDLNVPKYAIRSHLTQRSADMFLGVPFNITSYAILTKLIARFTNTIAEEFVWNGVNCHIYTDHMDQVKEQLIRPVLNSPTIVINENITMLSDIEDMVTVPDRFLSNYNRFFDIQNYNHGTKIHGNLSVGN